MSNFLLHFWALVNDHFWVVFCHTFLSDLSFFWCANILEWLFSHSHALCVHFNLDSRYSWFQISVSHTQNSNSTKLDDLLIFFSLDNQIYRCMLLKIVDPNWNNKAFSINSIICMWCKRDSQKLQANDWIIFFSFFWIKKSLRVISLVIKFYRVTIFGMCVWRNQ